eukprot:264893_1
MITELRDKNTGDAPKIGEGRTDTEISSKSQPGKKDVTKSEKWLIIKENATSKETDELKFDLIGGVGLSLKHLKIKRSYSFRIDLNGDCKGDPDAYNESNNRSHRKMASIYSLFEEVEDID